MNVVNLERLETYLRQPQLNAEFDMAFYTGAKIVDGNETDCGSVGCAVGHGPYAHPDMAKVAEETWNEYCERVFGIPMQSHEWYWCFSGYWTGVDNTALGAAKRIRYLLLGKNIPENIEEDFEEREADKYIALYENL